MLTRPRYIKSPSVRMLERLEPGGIPPEASNNPGVGSSSHQAQRRHRKRTYPMYYPLPAVQRTSG